MKTQQAGLGIWPCARGGVASVLAIAFVIGGASAEESQKVMRDMRAVGALGQIKRAKAYGHQPDEVVTSPNRRATIHNVTDRPGRALTPNQLRNVTTDGTAVLEKGAIPKVVHHIYKVNLRKNGTWPNRIWKASFDSWIKLFPEPEFKHIFWSDATAGKFFRKRCSKHYSVYKDACKKQTEKKGKRASLLDHATTLGEHVLPMSLCREIVRADLVRYCILHHVGGIYSDLDYEPRRNFYKDLQMNVVNLVQSPYKSETLQNSLMASPPGHWYWEKVLESARGPARLKTDVLEISGPRLLEAVNETHDQKIVHQLPCNEFQRATHSAGGESESAEDKGCKMLKATDVDDDDLRGIHWGTISWNAHGLNPQAMQLFKAFHDVLHTYEVLPKLKQWVDSLKTAARAYQKDPAHAYDKPGVMRGP